MTTTRTARFTISITQVHELEVDLDEVRQHHTLALPDAVYNPEVDTVHAEQILHDLLLTDPDLQDFVVDHGEVVGSGNATNANVEVYDEENHDINPITYEVTFLINAYGGDEALAAARTILGEHPHQVRIEVQP